MLYLYWYLHSALSIINMYLRYSDRAHCTEYTAVRILYSQLFIFHSFQDFSFFSSILSRWVWTFPNWFCPIQWNQSQYSESVEIHFPQRNIHIRHPVRRSQSTEKLCSQVPDSHSSQSWVLTYLKEIHNLRHILFKSTTDLLQTGKLFQSAEFSHHLQLARTWKIYYRLFIDLRLVQAGILTVF